jgi:acyl carrier protein
MSIQKEVIDIVVEQLGVDANDVTLEKSFVEDLNADSLDLTELIMTFEERFGFEISEEEAEKLKTVVMSLTTSSKKRDSLLASDLRSLAFLILAIDPLWQPWHLQ